MSDYFKQTQARLKRDTERYEQVSQLRSELTKLASVLSANIEAYQRILEIDEEYGQAFQQLPERIAEVSQLIGSTKRVSESVSENESGNDTAKESEPVESVTSFELQPPAESTNGHKSRGDNMKVILEALKKFDGKALTSGEIWDAIQDSKIKMNRNTMYSSIYKLKKSGRLKLEGNKYSIPIEKPAN